MPPTISAPAARAPQLLPPPPQNTSRVRIVGSLSIGQPLLVSSRGWRCDRTPSRQPSRERSNGCSQIWTTFQPIRRRQRWFRASRRVAAILVSLLSGSFSRHCGKRHPCQKSPSTKTAPRSARNTKSSRAAQFPYVAFPGQTAGCERIGHGPLRSSVPAPDPGHDRATRLGRHDVTLLESPHHRTPCVAAPPPVRSSGMPATFAVYVAERTAAQQSGFLAHSETIRPFAVR